MTRTRHRVAASLGVATSLAMAAGAPGAMAHPSSTSFARLQLEDKRIALELSFAPGELVFFKELDLNQDLLLSDEELATGRAIIAKRVVAGFHVALDDHALAAQNARIARADGDLLLLAEYDRPAGSDRLTVRSALDSLLAWNHVAIVRIEGPELDALEAALDPLSPSRSWALSSKRPPTWPTLAVVAEYMRLGAEHILRGWDHLAFLVVALLGIGRGARKLVAIVTSFTVAHSLTLALSVTGTVFLPGRFVECAIALSIAYTALENLCRIETAPRPLLTFAFGLVHGFGFADLLRERGFPQDGRALALFSFNLGVEIGQLALLAIVLLTMRAVLRRALPPRLVAVVSGVVFAQSLVWFFQRAA